MFAESDTAVQFNWVVVVEEKTLPPIPTEETSQIYFVQEGFELGDQLAVIEDVQTSNAPTIGRLQKVDVA